MWAVPSYGPGGGGRGDCHPASLQRMSGPLPRYLQPGSLVPSGTKLPSAARWPASSSRGPPDAFRNPVARSSGSSPLVVVNPRSSYGIRSPPSDRYWFPSKRMHRPAVPLTRGCPRERFGQPVRSRCYQLRGTRDARSISLESGELYTDRECALTNDRAVTSVFCVWSCPRVGGLY